jgi:hypothetical protein
MSDKTSKRQQEDRKQRKTALINERNNQSNKVEDYIKNPTL